jgi:hypothetical protein
VRSIGSNVGDSAILGGLCSIVVGSWNEFQQSSLFVRAQLPLWRQKGSGRGIRLGDGLLTYVTFL